MSKAEELEKKLQERRDARAKKEEAQYEVDLEARIALEDEYGQLTAVKVSRFVEGQPTFALVRTPSGVEYKRFKDQVHRAMHDGKNEARKKSDAVDLLAKACWVYPAEDAQADMLDAFPGLLTTIANVASALAEGKSESEGKG